MMTNGKSAGASRRSRRLALNSAVVAVIAVSVLLTMKRISAHPDGDEAWGVAQRFSRPDAVLAEQLLRNVAGANAVLCAAVERSFQTGSWGNSVLPLADGSSAEDDEVARWIGRERLDRGVLEPARRALTSADPCTRRIAAHLAGNVTVANLERELDAELSSATPATQVAAVMALGYAEQRSATPRLRRLVDAGDRSVRLAAIWALGSIEDKGSTALLVKLLRDDADANVRRLAAWALGRIEDR